MLSADSGADGADPVCEAQKNTQVGDAVDLLTESQDVWPKRCTGNLDFAFVPVVTKGGRVLRQQRRLPMN